MKELDYLWYISGGKQHGRLIDADLADFLKEKATYRLVGINRLELKKQLTETTDEDLRRESNAVLFDEVRRLEEKDLEILEDDLEPEYVEDDSEELEIIYRKGKVRWKVQLHA